MNILLEADNNFEAIQEPDQLTCIWAIQHKKRSKYTSINNAVDKNQSFHMI
jgi:hypothetical protein